MARILVVDDEEGLRAFLRDALAGSGHDVTGAADGEEAERLARAEVFELVVTDLKMPRKDGLSLLRDLRERDPEIEVIVLTAHGSVDSAVEAMKLGAFDYLQKPISSPAELRLIAERALERRRLRSEREIARRGDEPPLTYGAPSMEPVVRALEKVAPTEATVLLLGESGTGKELAARAIHRGSARAHGPFVAINCAALSESLLESELFGHERGAFTGAAARRRGRLELADGGTFFLDEVGELAPALQAKLLRVLQERVFERVGGNQSIRTDVRWVAATNRDLLAMTRDGTFREDLYHRLSVFPVQLPALRDRPEDIGPMAETLLARVAADLGRPALRLDESAIRALRRARWTGNARELANALERSAILAEGPVLTETDLAFSAPGAPPSAAEPTKLVDLEREAIRRALAEHDGNRKLAAESLGIGLRTLYDKIKRYEL